MRGDEYVDVVIDVVFGDDDDDDDNDDNESSNVNFPSSKKKFFSIKGVNTCFMFLRLLRIH